jgi:hypothetical protein
VVGAVPRHERDAAPADLADHDGSLGGPNGRLDLDLARVVEQRVQAGAADDADRSGRSGRRP